ncbi:MAG: hypothetical protein KatS3mg060_1595 [Dehalococcoidia bacterium]|nr:MAG: hypothetical protein KatS3mg060_1595 [Dehalococcoidia bacterium]
MKSRVVLTVSAAALLVLTSPYSGLAGSRVGESIARVVEQAPPGVCYGDEQMTFWPQSPIAGQPTTVTVTSARPSTNVGLQGPWNPQFVGVQPGGKGYNWYYRFTPDAPGQYNFNFTINGWVCTANVVNVVGSGPPPPPPPPPPSGGSGGGVNYQIANPTALSSGTMSISVSNQNCSGNLNISIIVAGPLQVGGATARSANFTLYGCNWLTVQYPQQFPGAAPLAGGQYHVEITDRQGNDYVSTYVQVQ